MSQPDGAGASPQTQTLKETLVEAHSRAADAVTLSGRRIRNAVASGDLGGVETAAADLVVTLVQVSEVVASRIAVTPEVVELPTPSLFQSSVDVAAPRASEDGPAVETLSASFASLGRPPAAAGGAGGAQGASHSGVAVLSSATAPATTSAPSDASSPGASSPLSTGLAGGLRSLQQVPERVNQAISKVIEADDLSSNAELVREAPPWRRRIAWG